MNSKRHLFHVSLLLMAIASTTFAKTVDRDRFIYKFNEYNRSKLAPTKTTMTRASRYSYVFVGGMLNEKVGGQFPDNRGALIRFGIKRSQIFIIHPKSKEAIRTNAQLIAAELSKIYLKTDKPMVLIAHSKGAAEILAIALTLPELMKHKIAAAFLIQGAIGGSALADHFTGAGATVDHRMPRLDRMALSVIDNGVDYLKSSMHRGIKSLTKKNTSQLWKYLLTTHSIAQFQQDKIYYISSKQKYAKLSSVLIPTGSYLTTYYGANDGLVEQSAHFHSQFGTHLAMVDADHTDLTGGWPISNGGTLLRYALMAAIVDAVGSL